MCTDFETNPSREDINLKMWQSSLMDRFFHSISEKGKIELSRHCVAEDYCSEWQGILCQDGRIVKVFYSGVAYGQFALDTLPPTVNYVMIVQCAQKYKVETRSLPREAKCVWLHKNHLYGSINLTTLPSKLIHLGIWENNLSGAISLVDLPRNLVSLKLYENKIQQSVVFYSNLPASIDKIELVKIGRFSEIGEVRALHPEDVVVRKEIFPNFPIIKIH